MVSARAGQQRTNLAGKGKNVQLVLDEAVGLSKGGTHTYVEQNQGCRAGGGYTANKGCRATCLTYIIYNI